MFSPAPEPPLTPPAGWRDALRHAAELTVAFTTLESYTVDDVWPPRRTSAAQRTRQVLDLPAARREAVAARRDLPGSPLEATAATAATATTAATEAKRETRAPARRPAAATRSTGRAGGERRAERRPGAGRTPAQPCTAPLAAGRPSAFAPATAAAARTAAARTATPARTGTAAPTGTAARAAGGRMPTTGSTHGMRSD